MMGFDWVGGDEAPNFEPWPTQFPFLL